MARFTTSGAPSGAAAWPKRRRARAPGTVGPDDGKMFAFADDTIMAKTAAPIRILGLRGCTSRFRSVSYAIRIAFAKKKTAEGDIISACCAEPRFFLDLSPQLCWRKSRTRIPIRL